MKDNHKNLILQKITGLNKEQLFFNPPPSPLPNKQGKLYDDYIQRLELGEPIEYILKHAEFYGLDFYVDNRVLIPRNDTEIMVDLTIKQSGDIYIDVGTGSGCIPIAVLKSIIIPPPAGTPFEKGRNLECYALDISEKALEIANINVKKHNLQNKITLLQSDLLEKILEKNIQNKQIIITANLPYIKQDDFQNMDESVYVNEPDIALYGGEKTGFELYEKLIGQCQELKKIGNKIILFIEIGFDQKQVCENFLESQGLIYEVFQDRGGVDRCVKIEI